MRLISCSLKDPGTPKLFDSGKSVGGGCRANPRDPGPIDETIQRNKDKKHDMESG